MMVRGAPATSLATATGDPSSAPTCTLFRHVGCASMAAAMASTVVCMNEAKTNGALALSSPAPARSASSRM